MKQELLYILYTYTHTYMYIGRDRIKLYVMGLSEEVAGEGEKMLGNEKY
jgi:hypothetical protein